MSPTPSVFPRAIVLVLDSVGIGELPDASVYGDQGSNTLGNVARRVRLHIPTLQALGIGNLLELPHVPPVDQPSGAYGKMAERSPGKDSVTGHWELMGLVLDRAFPVFPDGFPAEVMAQFEGRIGRSTLGNRAASGTQIIQDLGVEHLQTGAPIVYTSADSVFQIAAHEDVVSVTDLYRMCEVAFEIVCKGEGVARVIARPFVGTPGNFVRTARRRDFALAAVGDTVLDRLVAGDWPVMAVGKIEDLFARRGVTEAVHPSSDDEVMEEVVRALNRIDRGLVFANLVDFDMLYGHRNNVEGYATNLERFDRRLAELLPALRPHDLLILTADHGNDPTTPSTDHSREYVPLLVVGRHVRPGTDLGVRDTFADLGQTLGEYFGLERLPFGTSFLKEAVAGPS